MQNIDLTQIIGIIISLIATIITVFVIPLLKKKLSTENMNNLTTWINIGVKAAEQILGSGEGIAKKQYVLNFLKTKGFSIDSEEVDNMIEAAVLELTKTISSTAESK